MMPSATTKRHRKTTLVLSICFAIAIVTALPATAQPPNFGTIKVHDEPDTEPPQRNVPHVDCDFWIRGFNMSGTHGSIIIYSWPPTGNRSVVLEDTWNGTLEDDGVGHHFLNGPYMLPDGHYRVEAFSEDGHPGNRGHFAKTKTFWVECVEEGGAPESLPCPPTLLAIANQDATITVQWEPAPGSDATILYRAVGDGPFEFVDAFDNGTTQYVDTDTELHVTYTYTVTALFGDRESQDCPMVEATAIPFFPAMTGLLLATAFGVAAYAGIRRRA
jgi:hypothetical protein